MYYPSILAVLRKGRRKKPAPEFYVGGDGYKPSPVEMDGLCALAPTAVEETNPLVVGKVPAQISMVFYFITIFQTCKTVQGVLSVFACKTSDGWPCRFWAG